MIGYKVEKQSTFRLTFEFSSTQQVEDFMQVIADAINSETLPLEESTWRWRAEEVKQFVEEKQ